MRSRIAYPAPGVLACILMLMCTGAAATGIPAAPLPIPDGFVGSAAEGTNASGQIVGYCVDAGESWYACVWGGKSGPVTIIDDRTDGVLDSCEDSEAIAINSSGTVLGVAYDYGDAPDYPYYYEHAFVYRDGKTIVLPPFAGDDSTYPVAMTDAGAVVGYSVNNNGPSGTWVRHGFIWQDSNGNNACDPDEMVRLIWRAPDRYGNTVDFSIVPEDINESGQVIGTVWDDQLSRLSYYPAVLWDSGTAGKVSVEHGWDTRINASGQVAYDTGTLYQNPWLYTPGAGLRELKVSTQYPDDPTTGYGSCWIEEINDQGHVLVVAMDRSPGCLQRLFVWQDDGSADGLFTEVPLGTLLPPGQAIRQVWAVMNSQGQVAGTFQDQSDLQGSFFWDPEDPGTIRSLGVLPGDTAVETWPLNMGDSGLIVGASSDGLAHGCTWDPFALPNQAPIAEAGPDQSVTVPHDGNTSTGTAAVTLDGSGSSDPESGALTYSWSENGAQIATGARPTVNLTAGMHTITLTVTDPENATGSDAVTITVSPEPNKAPTANAGPDQTTTATSGAARVTLNGSGSSDPDNDALTYSWTENGAKIASGVQPSVSLGVGVHTITLTVTDPYGAISADNVVVTVSEPAPVLTVTIGSITRKGRTITVSVTIGNSGASTANDVSLTTAALAGVSTSTRLPLSLKSIRQGTSKEASLKFDGGSIPVGTATISVVGTYSAGSFSRNQTVNVP